MINNLLDLKEQINENLYDLIDEDYVLFDVPEHRNIGDQLIWCGDHDLSETNNKTIKWHQYLACFSDVLQVIFRRTTTDDDDGRRTTTDDDDGRRDGRTEDGRRRTTDDDDGRRRRTTDDGRRDGRRTTLSSDCSSRRTRPAFPRALMAQVTRTTRSSALWIQSPSSLLPSVSDRPA